MKRIGPYLVHDHVVTDEDGAETTSRSSGGALLNGCNRRRSNGKYELMASNAAIVKVKQKIRGDENECR